VGSFFVGDEEYHCEWKGVRESVFLAGSQALQALDFIDDDNDEDNGPTVKDLLKDRVPTIVGDKRAGKFLTQVEIFKTEILKNENGPVSL
jgi:hypothetical protein